MGTPPIPLMPRGRDDIVFRRVGEDWVLFDPRAQEIHVLNLTAALVWSFCTGDHDVDAIEAQVRDVYDGVREPQVREVIGRFATADLLTER